MAFFLIYPTVYSNRTQCFNLCAECNCLGYYCGTECICECVSDADKDISCLANLKTNSDKLNLPYDVLIQGAAGRRFVREVRDLSPKQETFYKTNERQGRSVYNIHAPNPWKSGKEEPMAFEDLSGRPGLGGDVAAWVAKLKTDTGLLALKKKIFNPAPTLALPLTKAAALADIEAAGLKFKEDLLSLPNRLETSTALKFKSLLPQRENILQEKIHDLAAAVDTPRRGDTVADTLLKIKEFKVQEIFDKLSPNAIVTFVKGL
ncbi:hypothetical protein DMENIID0001_140040 [Sergentomyia squamirostris]